MKDIIKSFKDKVIVITGGSSGIGKQLTISLAKEGAIVIICSSDEEKLEQTKTELASVGLIIDICLCDVRNENQIQQFANVVANRYGHIDILINNAGYAVYRSFEESTIEENLDILDVNLSGAMRCTKAFLPKMISSQKGRIVNISSIGGKLIITPNAVYCAAKHGMVAWSKALGYELSQFNIGVNVICPSYVRTHFHDHPTFRRRDVYRKKEVESMTIEYVSERTLDAIRHDRKLTYIPSWSKIIVWALDSFPIVLNPIWNIILRKRIKQLYEQIENEKLLQSRK